MILPVSPDAPLLVRGAASAILLTHIGGAAVGLVSGFAAMAFRKGGALHRATGTAFFAGMLGMSGVGAAVAPFVPDGQQLPNTLAGLFTFYLVTSGWATVRRKPGEVGRFEAGALVASLAVAIGSLGFGVWSALTQHPLPQPEGPVVYVFSAVAALAAAGDFGVIRQGGLAGGARLRRHLWRMSLALVIAAGSFAGQPKAIPPFLRGSPLLLLPVLLVLALMIFWLFRTREPNRRTAREHRAGQADLRHALGSAP
jgi:hypothetical protein